MCPKTAANHLRKREDREVPVVKGCLRQLIPEELAAIQRSPEAKKSWAAMTTAATASTTKTQPALAAKMSQPSTFANFDMVVRAENATEDLKKGTAQEVVTVVNAATGRSKKRRDDEASTKRRHGYNVPWTGIVKGIMPRTERWH
jgi:hypothetical protein